MKSRSWSCVALFVGLAVAAAGVSAQQAGQPAGGTGERARPAPQPIDAKTLREQIDKRLEDHRAAIKRLEEAQRKLDAGGDPDAIAREAILEGFRDARRTMRGPVGDDPSGGQRGSGFGSEFSVLSGRPLSAADKEKARALLQEKHPELLQKVTALAGTNNETRERYIDGVGGRVIWLENIRAEKPAEYDLRLAELNNGVEVIKLAREISDAKKKGVYEDGASAFRSRLVVLMTSQFDTRQDLSKLLLRQLREGADKQEAAIADKDKNRAKLIQQRADDFLKMLDKPRRSEKTEKQTGGEKPAGAPKTP